MDLKRFFAPPPKDNRITLAGEEFYHAVKTTRHKEGFLIIVSTGDGYDYLSRITRIDKDFLIAEVIEKTPNNTEPAESVSLFQGVCKEFDFIVRKAVELGVTDIYPFYSERTNIREISLERLERIVKEAAKQCGRARLPVLHDLVPFSKALQLSRGSAHRIMCYEEHKDGYISDAINKDSDSKSAALYIGSEGGFTPQEAAEAEKEGIKPVTLGKRILKAETAAVSAITLTMSALGEM